MHDLALALALACLVFALPMTNCQPEALSESSRRGEALDGLIDRLTALERAGGRPVAASCLVSVTAGSTLKLMSNWSNAKLDFTHIPKTAGTSARLDLKKLRPNKKMLRSMQKCFMDTPMKKAKYLYFLRNPSDHVYSQFAMCRDSSFGMNQTKGRSFPRSTDRMADYDSFLNHFIALTPSNVGAAHDFGCQDPRDTLARHLSCSRLFNTPIRFQGVHPANHAFTPPPNLDVALSNIHAADFVGITYLYEESICYLNYVVTNKMPSVCYHEEHQNVSNTDHVFSHKSYGVQHVSASELAQPAVMDKVANITALDSVVFRNGLLRFLCDLRFLEQSLIAERAKFITKDIILITEDKIKRFAAHISYLL
jgi:hypothetical protein